MFVVLLLIVVNCFRLLGRWDRDSHFRLAAALRRRLQLLVIPWHWKLLCRIPRVSNWTHDVLHRFYDVLCALQELRMASQLGTLA